MVLQTDQPICQAGKCSCCDFPVLLHSGLEVHGHPTSSKASTADHHDSHPTNTASTAERHYAHPTSTAERHYLGAVRPARPQAHSSDNNKAKWMLPVHPAPLLTQRVPNGSASSVQPPQSLRPRPRRRNVRRQSIRPAIELSSRIIRRQGSAEYSGWAQLQLLHCWRANTAAAAQKTQYMSKLRGIALQERGRNLVLIVHRHLPLCSAPLKAPDTVCSVLGRLIVHWVTRSHVVSQLLRRGALLRCLLSRVDEATELSLLRAVVAFKRVHAAAVSMQRAADQAEAEELETKLQQAEETKKLRIQKEKADATALTRQKFRDGIEAVQLLAGSRGWLASLLRCNCFEIDPPTIPSRLPVAVLPQS